MKAKSLSFIAAMLFSLSAHAHDCSGGANGGMDATGNQCNDVASVAMLASSDAATAPGARLPNTDKRNAAPHNKDAMKHTVAARHSSSRAQSKHS